jgi:hypothetical protein
LRVRWLKWLLKALVIVHLVPILGCAGIMALLVGHAAITKIPSNVIRTAREEGGLAPLPPSATGIRTDGWSNGFASGRHIRFSAPPREIEAFLAASPGLKGVRPERFHPRHMYIPYPKEPKDKFGSIEEIEESVRHKHFSLNGPAWYNPTVRVRGRRYEIPWRGKAYWGEVVVDDTKHVVFILTSYS